MRFMIMVRTVPEFESEPTPVPDEALFAAMAAYHEELARAGVLLDASGLQPSRTGWRIHYGAEGRRVVDGPFAETKELIAGYTLIQVRSREEALEWSRRFPNPVGEGRPAVVEVRQLFELEDFGDSPGVERFRELNLPSRGGAAMSRQIFVNLPVRDLERSKAFFVALGMAIVPRFTNEQAACVRIADGIYTMLLVEPFFQGFTKLPVADARRSTEVLLALSCDSRDEVDALVAKAAAAGATTPNAPQDHGFMVQHGFADPDGHQWEVFWMDEKAAPERC